MNCTGLYKEHGTKHKQGTTEICNTQHISTESEDRENSDRKCGKVNSPSKDSLEQSVISISWVISFY